MPRATHQHGARRSAVLDAAIDNFTTLGYHGTSMRDIASSASLTVATIYHYYSSKQFILLQIMSSTMEDVIDLSRASLRAAGPDPARRLAALVRVWIVFHTTRQREALIGASELRSLEEDGRALVVRLRDQQEALFRDVVEEGAAAGVFRTSHPRDAARAIINMGYAVASWYRTDGPVSPAEMADRYVGFALGVVDPAPSAGTLRGSAS